MKWLFIVLLLGMSSFAHVWEGKQVWTPEWESKYSAWVTEHWHNDIFTNEESELYGLETDCADASYVMRSYFAFLNDLPILFHRHNGTLITQKISLFDGVKEPMARFKKFLIYLFDETDTYTLSLDTYAVDVNRESMRAGIVYVSPGIHSYQITGIDEFGIPETLSSTVPKEKRVLFNHHGYPFYLPGESQNYSDGFRAFRTTGREVNSREQFEITERASGDFIAYQKIMIQKLQLRSEPFERRIARIKDNLCFFARERTVLVADAFVKKMARKGACFGPSEFDDYSTYIRDKKLKHYFLEFKKMTSDQEWFRVPVDEKNKLLSVFLAEVPDQECTIETSLAQKPTLRLSEVYAAIESGRLVSDPNATMMQRWGLEPYKPQCPLY